ncbi:hypothetical protein GXP67_26125 [Rhodocytophaga rosea]|uniref:Glycerophosphoryl diester phosphodiesterase membrane domain-containing protein n=1 Tax=Rhodocytophaga rosea TaxID=2704465 RepID=A0A6C0GPP1_9BACT|nr:hypothetical protein [Rhodocytophaga rosea]QHT69877.1 hypothetical protein GXP67_26125 [Rhodocytophaga rosea]
MLNKIEFRRKRDFGEILNVSFTFIRQNYQPIFKSLLFIAGPFILVGSVLPGLLFSPSFGTEEGGLSQVDFTQVIVNVLSFVVGSVMAVGVVYEYMLLYEKNDGAPLKTGEVWKAVRKSFFRILITIIGMVVLLGGGFFLAGVVAFNVMNGVLAFFLLISGGTYLTVVFSILLIVSLSERVHFFKAIIRCFTLMQGSWWLTFALLFICGVVQGAMVTVVFLPFSFLGASEDLFSPSANSFTSSLIVVALAGIVFILSVTLSFCLTLIVSGFQYFSLVEQKEATGLLKRIQDMGSPASPARDLYEDSEEDSESN